MPKEEFDFDSILNTDTEIKEQKPEVKIEEKTFFNVKEKAFDKLKDLLTDTEYIDTLYLDRNTCATVINLMDELVRNGGKLDEGTKSRDGFILHGCPKHDWSPIHVCVNCNHWKGGKTPNGCCTATESDADNPEYQIMEKFSHDEAKRREIHYRREKGRYFA